MEGFKTKLILKIMVFLSFTISILEALTITGISPRSGLRNSVAQVYIYGSELTTAGKIYLYRNGDIIPGQPDSILSDVAVLCSFDLKDAEPGVYNVVADDGDMPPFFGKIIC